jgi:hypothetical protein
MLAKIGTRLVLEVQRALVPLLRASNIARGAQLVAKGDPLPPFDCYLPLLSLPGVSQTTLRTIPLAEGYLTADEKLVEHWRGVLGEKTKLRVGIAWHGSPTYRGDRDRSIPLAEFEALALPGVELVSLQKGFGSEQVGELAGKFPVRELDGLDEEHGAFMDTAAVMQNLDLVATSDTAIAHLGGALGVETWVALTLVPDWRWMHEREDSPWYQSLRLFRQRRLGDWGGVFGRMAEEMKQRLRRG